MNLTTVHDPDKQLTALVDLDTFTGYGPAMPGPQGPELLQAWLDSLPYDISGADSGLAASFFMQFLERTGQMPADTPEASQEAPGGPPATADAGSDRLAQAEAQTASQPPPPAPADSDPTAGGGPTPAAPSDTSPAAPAADAASGNGNGGPGPDTTAEAPAPPDASAQAPATVEADCATCNGTGKLTYQGEAGPVTNDCGICGGTGKVQVTAT